jgi:hypothetical protein
MKKLLMPLLAMALLSCTSSNAQKEENVNVQAHVNVDDNEVHVNIDTEEINRTVRKAIHHEFDKKETHKEMITKEFEVNAKTNLRVYNIFGNVKVEGYSGSKVMVEVEKTLKANDKDDLEKAKSEVKLGFDLLADTLTFYTAEPYDTRPKKTWNRDNNNQKRDYLVYLNYTIKVPKGLSLRISTVNDGEIVVANVDGIIKANNVNGGIALSNVRGANDVHTVNGNVKINFLSSPPENSKFYTLNGKLEIIVPNDFSADCEFKSFNGNFYTDFDQVESLPSIATKTEKKTEDGVKYRLNKTSAYRFGSGGKKIKVETFTGNAYIKKTS